MSPAVLLPQRRWEVLAGKVISRERATIGGWSRDRHDFVSVGRDEGVKRACGDGDGDAADDIPSGRKWVDSVGKVVNVIGSHQMIVSLMVQSEKQMVKKGQKELARRVGDLVQKLKRHSWYCRHEGDVGG